MLGRSSLISSRALLGVVTLGGLLAFAGCTTHTGEPGRNWQSFQYQSIRMRDDARIKPYESSPLPGEIASARPIPAGTVARGQLAPDDPLRTGRLPGTGELLEEPPIEITPAVLQRGQERYNVFCSPCHSRVGDGEGLVVLRGFPHPPDFAIQRLRDARIGHFFDVMTHGYGVMYSYAERVPPTDRWAIAAYIRVLQEARDEVPEEQFEEERELGRRRGIPDPMRLPGVPNGVEPDPHGHGGLPPHN